MHTTLHTQRETITRDRDRDIGSTKMRRMAKGASDFFHRFDAESPHVASPPTKTWEEEIDLLLSLQAVEGFWNYEDLQDLPMLLAKLVLPKKFKTDYLPEAANFVLTQAVVQFLESLYGTPLHNLCINAIANAKAWCAKRRVEHPNRPMGE